jgi:transposase
MSYLDRYMEAARKLRLLRVKHKRLVRRFRRFRTRKKQILSPYNRLFLAYEEALKLARIERALFGWMHEVSTGGVAYEVIESQLKHKESPELLRKLYQGTRSETRLVQVKALTILFHLHGINLRMVAKFLRRGFRTLTKYVRRFRSDGVDKLLRGNRKSPKRSSDPRFIEMLFSTLHCPPSDLGINRTTWTQKLLSKVMTENGCRASAAVVSEIIKNAGYKFRKAREVLTSNDPGYRNKLKKITRILSHLDSQDRFFSIDEFGPFAVKQKGGRSWVPPNMYPTIPQWQRSKGCLIITAALELSRNQVTHFYSTKKDSSEMIRLLDILLDQYSGCRRIYFSWDAASWHASKRFLARVKVVNSPTYRQMHQTPIVKLAPLPARAQFLNVIESIFGGMARAIIHNSDYESVDRAKEAIDRYFRERNEHFAMHPRRAGNKIWGREIVASEFKEAQNCKYARWR